MSAGVLHFSGGGLDGGAESGTQALELRLPGGYSGGDELRVQATGGEFPAFSVSARAPNEVTLFNPLCPSGDCGFIDRNSALSVQWEPVDAGFEVLVGLSVITPETQTVIACAFPPSRGSGSVPLEAIQAIPAREDGGVGVMAVQTRQTEVVDGGAFRLVLQVLGNPSSGTFMSW